MQQDPLAEVRKRSETRRFSIQEAATRAQAGLSPCLSKPLPTYFHSSYNLSHTHKVPWHLHKVPLFNTLTQTTAYGWVQGHSLREEEHKFEVILGNLAKHSLKIENKGGDVAQ